MNEEKIMAVEAEEVVEVMTKKDKAKKILKKAGKIGAGLALGAAGVAIGLIAKGRKASASENYEGEYAYDEVCDETENV